MLCRAAIAVGLLVALDAVASAQPAPPDNPPSAAPPAAAADAVNAMEEPAVGDHWTYEVRDEITGTVKFTSTNTITDVTPAEIAIRIEWPGKPQIGYFVYDRSWNMKTNQVWKFSPNDGSGLKLPLKVGNTWNFQGSDLSSSNSVSFKRTGSSKVLAAESVTTSAGTFDTFKIETSLTVRNANDPSKKAESQLTSWYAPAIDHWVKRSTKTLSNGHVTQSVSTELVDYGRR